jgi:hypothetical protein
LGAFGFWRAEGFLGVVVGAIATLDWVAFGSWRDEGYLGVAVYGVATLAETVTRN